MKTPAAPYRNQRLGKPKVRKQQHLLEVSIRRDKEQARQVRRAVSVVIKSILVAALCAGAWFGTKEGLRRWFWENPAFYLTEVRFSTDGALTREQVLTAAGVVTGRNIFSLDLQHVREALSALPQVEQVRVHRQLFNELELEILERQPIAWITEKAGIEPTRSDRAYLIDARGYIIKPKRLLPEYDHLPVICGAVYENLAPGQKTNAIELQAALELLRLSGDSTRWQARQVDVTKGYCLVVTDRRRARVTFGVEDIDKQLARFYRVLDHVERSQRELRTVNLLVERNTPVTLMEPEAERPPEPTAGEVPPAAKSAVAEKVVPPAAAVPAPAGAAKKKEPAPAKAETKPKSAPAKSAPQKRKTAAASAPVRKPAPTAQPTPAPVPVRVQAAPVRRSPFESIKRAFRANG